MPEYSYRPLRTATTIRLLLLDAGAGDDPLRGHLYDLDLHTTRQEVDPNVGPFGDYMPEVEPYEALSYVWGEMKFSSSLLCMEGEIAITPNLDLALRHVRLQTSARVVWADGVCINQKDLHERGLQVKMMGNIYARARKVLVWLGLDPDQKAAQAFSALHSYSGVDPTLISTVTMPMKEIVKQEWFTRIWVIQELLLPRRALLLWGNESYEYDSDFRTAMTAYMERQRFSGQHWIVLPKWHMNFLDVLACTRNSSCTDERDRIFALLGLRFNTEQPLTTAILKIEPDYRRPVERLYFQVACIGIESLELQDILSNVAHDTTYPPHPLDLALPSWVPNWSCSGGHSPIDRAHHDLYPKSAFHLPRNTRPVATYLPKLNNGSGILSVKGIKVTTITETMDADLDPDALLATVDAVSYFWHQTIMPLKLFLGRSEYALMEFHFVKALAGQWNYQLTDRWYHIAQAIFAPAGSDRDLLFYIHDHAFALAMMVSLRKTSEVLSLGWDKRIPVSVQRFWRGRRLFLTKHGFVGLGPADIQSGDTVAMFSGTNLWPTPFTVVVRRGRFADTFRFIGSTYVPGLVDHGLERIWDEMSGNLGTFHLE